MRPLSVTLAELEGEAKAPSKRTPASAPPRSKAKPKPQLGLTLEDLEPAVRTRLDLPSGGGLVAGVARGSVASEAGLRPGDVVVSVAGTPAKSAAHAQQMLSAADLEAGVRIRVQSGQYGRFVVLRRR